MRASSTSAPKPAAGGEPEDSRDEPEDSRDEPEDSRDEPEDSRDEPEDSRDEPEDSRDEPEDSRDQPEDAIEVAVALPLKQTFTYRAGELREAALPGCRVLVPLGRRRVTGYVLGRPAAPTGGAELKPILAVLDESPVLTKELLDLCAWAADYYQHPIGEAIRTALPAGINVESERYLTLTSSGRLIVSALDRSPVATPKSLGEIDSALVNINRRGRAGVRVGKRRGWISPALADRLTRAGLTQLDTRTRGARVRDRKTQRVSALVSADDLDEALVRLGKAPLQASMLRWLVARGSVVIEELSAAFPNARSALRRLIDRQMVSTEPFAPRAERRRLDPEILAMGAVVDTPTPDQKLALEELTLASRRRTFAPFVLRGVTGSGKTEVYLRLIEQTMSEGGGALVLVPEIALTPQLAGRFKVRLGDSVAVLHSGLSESERHEEWLRLRSGEARVAVGVRSAVFAPVPDLRVVVVDEEHESSFKQEDGLRYNARDLAIVRARQAGAVAVLGSATPSIESIHNVRTGKYRELLLPRRVEGRELPGIQIVDLRKESRVPTREELASPAGGEAGRRLLSERLVTAIAETIAAGNQAILFLNRRGHTPTLICELCGQAVRCESCDVTMSLHRSPSRMLCHYCGRSCRPATVCRCGGGLRSIGAGTQLIEDELQSFLPSARLSRLDRDNTASRGSLSRILADFALGRTDVLIGTQMVAKGHDFPGVTLVGVLQAETGLSIPDFRASERTFQLLMQVAGRAGRGSNPGRVLIQSWLPEHSAVSAAAACDFEGFSRLEMDSRQRSRWPPFCRLLMTRIEGKDAAKVEATALCIARRAERAVLAHPETGVEILGPAPSPISLLRGRTRWQLLAKTPSTHVSRWLGSLILGVRSEKGVAVSLDVDPVGML